MDVAPSVAKLALARLAITIRSPVLGMLPPEDLVVVVVVVVVVTVLESFCSWTWLSAPLLSSSSDCFFSPPALLLSFSSDSDFLSSPFFCSDLSLFSSELEPLSDSVFSEASSLESPFAASIFYVET